MRISHTRLASVFTVAIIMFTLPALAGDFAPLNSFPAPADGAYSVDVAGLPGGLFLAWNGDGVYLQSTIGGDDFELVASGYAGDPGFAALSPDGSTVLLGQGYGGNLYAFDPSSPADYAPAALVGNLSHFGGAFLTNDLVLLDAGTPDWNSELVVVDLSGAKRLPKAVVVKPEPYKLDKSLVPKPGYSSSLFVDRVNGRVYAMDAASRELRSFGIQALIDAHNDGVTLDWATDGTLVGTPGMFFSGGVTGLDRAGRLLVSGSEGWGAPGGIQLVDARLDDPAQAAVVYTLDPTGTQGYASGYVAPGSEMVLAVDEWGQGYLLAGYGCDVLCVDTEADADADGLPDCVECNLGTDWMAADTDGDGVSDGDEVAYGSDPLDPTGLFTVPASGKVALAALTFLLGVASVLALARRRTA